MSGTEDRIPDEAVDEAGSPSSRDLARPTEPPRLSGGLMNAVALILIGASIGVFWREVFQLTIRAVEALR